MTARDAAGRLVFPVDRPLRNAWFVPESYGHPAKLHLGLLQWLIDRYTTPGQTLADPMAGTGSLLLAAAQQRHVILREVEPRYLALCHANAARILALAGLLAGQISIDSHDAREPWGYTADVIITSPPYGNEMAATLRRKGMLSHQIRQRLARLERYDRAWESLLRGSGVGQRAAFLMHYGTHPAQIGHLRGDRYWAAMAQIYHQAWTALPAGGLLILILKDHIRQRQRVRVADQTVALCQDLGYRLRERHARLVHPLSLWQRRRRERGEPIVDEEEILVLERP